MKPIPKSEPPAFNPERRRFLRTALFAGAAFASGCKSNSDSQTPTRLFRNRPFPLGNSSITLKGCDCPTQTAEFEASGPGNRLQDSIAMRAPDSFRISGSGPQYEIYVSNLSCGTEQSADAFISEKSNPPTNDGEQARSPLSDLPVIGAGIALFGALAIWIMRRREQVKHDCTILSPRRR